MVTKERNYLENLDADRLVILKCILDKWFVMMSTTLHQLRVGSSGGVFVMMVIQHERPESLPIQNGLALLPLLFNFSFEYAIKKVQVNQVGMKLNGTYQLPTYAEDVNLLGDNVDSIKKHTETLIDASKEVGLEINIKKTKYMLLSRHQNAGQILT
jgi:hypothetical protein